MNLSSTYRVTFGPGTAAEGLLLDWLDVLHGHPALPWAQRIARIPLVRSAVGALSARGGVDRTFAFTRRLDYDDHAALRADVASRPDLIPLRTTGELEIRTLDLGVDPAAGVEARTSVLYLGSDAALVSCTPEPLPSRISVAWHYVVSLGALVGHIFRASDDSPFTYSDDSYIRY